MTKKQAEKINKYLSSLDDKEKNEYYGTQRRIAQDEIIAFFIETEGLEGKGCLLKKCVHDDTEISDCETACNSSFMKLFKIEKCKEDYYD
jgi:hypothetical protein